MALSIDMSRSMSDEKWKPVECSPVRDAFFVISSGDQDQLLRDLINSASSPMPQIEDTGPTILSLQDTIDLIVKKYGPDWRKYPECKCTVIWASSTFTLEHIKEIVPDLFELCFEYREHGTVNNKPFPENFFMLAFAVVDPAFPIEDYTP